MVTNLGVSEVMGFKRGYILIVLFVLISNWALTQQANVWYFGNYAGIDFNGTQPKGITGGKLNTNEGCAAICNASGRILFYTDGVFVIDSNHQVINPSAKLKGNSSSTQSAVVVPKPGSPNRFFIFTMDQRYSGCKDGMNYSEVDVTGGAVTLVSANIHLVDCNMSTEKIASTAHANGIDYWVTTFKGNGEFASWLVSSSGVSTTPVVSTVTALPCATNNDDRVGYMKISPKGKYLVLGRRWNQSQSEAFIYDNSTGMVAQNLGVFHTGTIYGVEFSSNENYFYTSEGFRRVVQYDWSFNRVVIHNSGTGGQRVGALQMGPDGNIYVANGYEGVDGNYIDRISDVNSPNPIYSNDFIALPAGTHSRLGLPNVVSSLVVTMKLLADKDSICRGDTAELTAIIAGDLGNDYTIHWSSENNLWTGTGQAVKVTPGVTTVYKAVLVQNGISKGDTQKITITVTPNAGPKAGFTVSPDNGCIPLIVTFTDNSQKHDATKNVWETGVTVIQGANTFTQTYTQAGTYDISLRVANRAGCSDSIQKQQIITVYENPAAGFISLPDSGCAPLTVTFTDTSQGHNASLNVWETGAGSVTGQSTFTHTYTKTGTYDIWLAVTSSDGCTDTVKKPKFIYVPETPVADFIIKNGVLEPNKPFILFNRSLYSHKYAWYFGDGVSLIQNTSAEFTHTFTDTGSFTIMLVAQNNLGCSDTVLKTVKLYEDNGQCFIPNGFTPGNEDGKNDFFGPVCESIMYYRMYIYNRWGQLIFNCENCFWDATHKGYAVPDGVYLYMIAAQAFNLKKSAYSGTITVLR